MGTDNLFHKRRAKKPQDLRRKNAKRESYDKVLVVCEGQKTEPLYFEEIKVSYELSSTNVKVDGKCGSSPSSVLDYAIEKYEEELAFGDPYDRVYCVFDKDAHASYQATLEKLGHLKYNKKHKVFFAINSVPCFEYWLLSHFCYSTKPYTKTGNKSAAECLLEDLKIHIPNYKKSQKAIFSLLADKLDDAKRNSARSLAQADSNGTDNPTTKVHLLVDYLQNLRR